MKNLGVFFAKGERTNIILFSMGEMVSLLGSAIYSFAISLYVLKLTGSGISFAITLIQGVIPTVLIGSFAGVLADKLNKKLLIVSMDIANAILFVMLFLISRRFGLTLPIIYITTFLMNAISVIFGISMESAKPNLVTDDNLIRINLISRIINSLSTILGPAIGGMIFVFADIKCLMLINGFSFFCSGISELFIDYGFNNREGNERCFETGSFTLKSILPDFKEGFLYTYRQKELKEVLNIFIVLNIVLGFSIMVPLPYAVNNVLELDPSAYGFIQGFLPVGTIMGAIAAGKACKKLSYGRIINMSVFIFGIVIIAMGIPLLTFAEFSKESCVIYYSILMIATGGAISFADVPLIQKLQTDAVGKYRGRVISTSICICKIALPVALVLAGILAEIIPVLWIFFGIGILSMFYALSM
ncbi:MAG TPA: MFS transporter [Candidatus Diapherotrites archaeon]|nr:MFS transporter [Candidatus Diapherotrites archaeon]